MRSAPGRRPCGPSGRPGRRRRHGRALRPPAAAPAVGSHPRLDRAAGRTAPRPGRRWPGCRFVGMTGPITSLGAGSSREFDHLGHRARRPGQRAIRTAGGKPSAARSASSRAARAGRVPPHERLHRRRRRRRPRPRPVPSERTSAAALAPSAKRLLGGPQVGPGEQRPAVEQQRRPVAVRRPTARRPAWRRPGRPGRDLGQHRIPARGAHRHARERPAELLRGAGRRRRRARASAARRTAGSASRPGRSAAPATARDRVARRGRERAGARRASGRGAIADAGQRRDVTPPRHLHENRAAARQRVSGGAPGQAGQPGRGGRRVARPLGVVADRGDAGRRRPDDRPVGDDLVGPAGLDQLGRLGGSREAADEQGRTGERGAQHQDVAGVRVGRSRLGVQVVAVVPDREQAEVGDRGERGGPSADDRAHGPPPDGQPAPVSLGRPEISGQRDVLVAAEPAAHRRVQPGQIPGIRNHDQRAAIDRRARWRRLPRVVPATPRRRAPTRRPERDAGHGRRPGRTARPGIGPSPGPVRRGPLRRERVRRPEADGTPRRRVARARPAARRRRTCRHTGRPPRGTASRSPGSARAPGPPRGPERPAGRRGRSTAHGRERTRRRVGRRTAPGPACRAPRPRPARPARDSRTAGRGGRAARRPSAGPPRR